MRSVRDVDALVLDLTAAAGGRVVVPEPLAATLIGVSRSTLRDARYRGDVVAMRTARNGPVRYTVRALAEYLVAGERRSLPELAAGERAARVARLEAARAARR